MSNFLNNANKNWSVVAGQIQNQAANGIVYIKESAFQIRLELLMIDHLLEKQV
jgi:hypothetical protein